MSNITLDPAKLSKARSSVTRGPQRCLRSPQELPTLFSAAQKPGTWGIQPLSGQELSRTADQGKDNYPRASHAPIRRRAAPGSCRAHAGISATNLDVIFRGVQVLVDLCESPVHVPQQYRAQRGCSTQHPCGFRDEEPTSAPNQSALPGAGGGQGHRAAQQQACPAAP